MVTQEESGKMAFAHSAGDNLPWYAYACAWRLTGSGRSDHSCIAVLVLTGTAGGNFFCSLPSWERMGTSG